MSWSLFGIKCGVCGQRTRDAVLASTVGANARVGPLTMVCKACSARLKSEADALAEAKRREAEEAKKRAAEAKRREVELDLESIASHRKRISCVAYNYDCTIAISGSGDGTIAIWDTASGECKRILRGQTGYVRAVALTSKGDIALSLERAGDDDSYEGHRQAALLWDVAAGTCLGQLHGEYDPSPNFDLGGTCPAFSPDGRIAMIVKSYGDIAAWDVATRLNLCATFLGIPSTEWGYSIPIAVGACSGQSYLLTGDYNTLRLFQIRDSSEWIREASQRIRSPFIPN